LRSWKSSWRGRIEICRVALRFQIKGGRVELEYVIRQIHRWLSIAFTVAVIVNVIAMMQEKQTVWVGLLALFPLILLLLSGLYLFALPYAAKWRGARM